MEDQNGNFETNEISSGEEKNQNVFRLESNREYEATFSFIDDESNRIFIHLEKFTENLQQIEARNSIFHNVTPLRNPLSNYVTLNILHKAIT